VTNDVGSLLAARVDIVTGVQAQASDRLCSRSALLDEIERVERVVQRPVFAAGGEIGVQQPKIRDAARIHHDCFAIQDQLVCRQRRERIGDGLEAQRPIGPRSRVDGGPAVSQVRLCPAAVEPDLVHPALA
jgi:hypothetical protein